MRTIDKYYHQDDGSFHSLWLGILILVSVITISGFLCCLRIKCNSRRRKLFNRPSNKTDGKDERNSGDDKQPQYYDPYKWPPPGRPPSNDLPDLYTLFRKIHIAEFDKKVFGKNSTDAEDKNKSESKSSVESDQQYHRHHHISVPQITVNTENPEIARRFFASISNSYQHPNFKPLDSYNSNSSLASNYPSSINVQPVSFTQEGNVKLIRTPCFLQSAPYTDRFTLAP